MSNAEIVRMADQDSYVALNVKIILTGSGSLHDDGQKVLDRRAKERLGNTVLQRKLKNITLCKCTAVNVTINLSPPHQFIYARHIIIFINLLMINVQNRSLYTS